MEGIFEAQDGVVSAVSGYAEGTKEEATYDLVSAWMTTHREAVEITYDPAKISFTTLVDLFYTQIDPTQVDGQFADKGFRYTTAAYYQDESEQMIIENARATLEKSWKFDKPIAVKTVPFTTFFPAEEYHQDYYKKSAFRYNLYKEGSGRKDFIDEYGKEWQTIAETENAPIVETKSTQYLPYDETKLATLTWSRIFLFFHASWCPTCVNFEKQILAAPLPSDVVIFKVDYDTATELKKKYSVLSQSTWVQIDSKWDMYKRWLGKSQLQDIFDDSIESKDLLLKKLTPLQYEVTQMGWTETPFDNEYWDHHEAWIYVDIVDGTPLFSSTDKFDSGTGWPSFTRPISESKVATETDTRYGMARTEIKSSTAGSHLWHVFNDGPSGSWGLRYCINSSALRFVPVADLEKEGYGEWKSLFKE